MSENTPENVTSINKNDKRTAEIGVEYGVGPMLPGSRWDEWVGTSEDGSVTNKPVVTIDQLVEMRRRDGQAKALIQLVTLPLRLALQTGTWVEPEDGDAGKEAEFANQMWSLPPTGGGMSTPQAKLVRQMLLSIVDGYAAFEIVRTVPQNGPLKGKITLQKLAYRDPRTITFKVDAQGGYAGFRQVARDGEGHLIDKDFKPLKTLVITQHDEFNPMYGVSLFESAYPHFDAKRKLYYIAHLAAQFAAVPGRIGKVPHGAKATEVQAFRQALGNFAFNAAMVIPPDYEVQPFNGNTGFDFLRLIDHHNLQMSKSILAAFFDNDQRTVLIENSSQDASADLFLSNIETIANDIAECLTHYLMPQFMDWNFGTKKYPVFKPGALSTKQKTQISELFKTVVTAGILNSTPEMVRQLEKKVSNDLGLDIDYDEIEKREKEAAEAKQEQEQAAADAQAQAQAAGVGPDGQPLQGAPGQQGGDGSGGVPPQAPNGGGPKSPVAAAPPIAASRTDYIDDLVLAAQNLFLGADDADLSPAPVDDTLGDA